MYYIGFDIGGSSVKSVLEEDEKIVKSINRDLPESLAGLLETMAKMIDGLAQEIDQKHIGGIGVGLPGTLDRERYAMLKSPNIPYLDKQPMRKLFEEKFYPYQIRLEHDAHCFLLAEKKIGLARDLRDVFCLTLGTGIGGAWMIGGKMYAGAHGAAGEAGHMIVDMNPNLDFEDIGSNKFIKKEMGFGSMETGTRAKAGDKQAVDFLCLLGKNLGIGIANVINIFDPEAVILAGGIAESRDFLLPGIREGIDKFVTSPDAKKTQILFSQLGREGGALGAALLWNQECAID